MHLYEHEHTRSDEQLHEFATGASSPRLSLSILGSYPGGGAVVSHQCVGSSCPSALGRAGARDAAAPGGMRGATPERAAFSAIPGIASSGMRGAIPERAAGATGAMPGTAEI